jgi:hypothetical protein
MCDVFPLQFGTTKTIGEVLGAFSLITEIRFPLSFRPQCVYVKIIENGN